MLKTKSLNRVTMSVTVLMLVAALLLWGRVEAVQGNGSHTMGYEDLLFDQSYVHTIDITMDNWDELIDTATTETYMECSITIDGEKYGSVAIRAKGNTSLSTVATLGSTRYSFKVEFDHYVKGMTYHSFDKLSLNNLIQDATMMKDYLAYTLMNRMGVPTPLCSFVQLRVNGEPWGLYLAVEGVEEGFLERNGMSKGELYKPDSLSFGGGRGNGKEFDFSQFSTNNDVSNDSDTSGNAPQSAPTMPDSSSQPSAPDSSADEFAPSSGAPANFPSGGDFAPSSGDRAQNPPSMPNFSFGGATSDSTDADTDGTTTRRTFSMPGGGFSFGMGSNDVKLIYSDDDPDSYSNIFDNAKTKISKKDKARLIESLRKLNAQEDIESVVDTNEVIRYLVVHNFLCNDDSYTGMMVHNYYLYEEDGQLCIIPWDYNLSFGGFSAAQDATSTVNSPIDSPVSGGTVDSRPLISWIFADDDALSAYHEAYSQFIAENFDSGWLAQEITRVQEMITPYLEQDSSKFYTMEEFEKAVETLQTFCDKRAQSIRGQLDGSIPSTSQGQQNSDALVDASDITTSDMGSMNSGKGGGMNFGGAGEFTMPTGFTMPGSAQGTAPSGFTPPDDASFGGSRGSPAQPQTSTAPEAAKSAAPDTTTSTPDTSRTPPEGFTRPDSGNGQETQWLQLGIYGAILLMGILIVRKMSAHNE